MQTRRKTYAALLQLLDIVNNLLYCIAEMFIKCYIHHTKLYLFSLDIDECSTKPCQNGGTCSNLVGGYRCTCAVGFRGTNCTIGSGTKNCTLQYKSAPPLLSATLETIFTNMRGTNFGLNQRVNTICKDGKFCEEGKR